MEAPAEEAEYEEGALATTTAVTQDEAPEAAATDVASKIIYSADLSAQTTDFDTAISTLDAQIAAFGGFIERSDVNGDTRYNNDGTTSIINRWAYYTIRVPASRFRRVPASDRGHRKRYLRQPLRRKRDLAVHGLRGKARFSAHAGRAPARDAGKERGC